MYLISEVCDLVSRKVSMGITRYIGHLVKVQPRLSWTLLIRISAIGIRNIGTKSAIPIAHLNNVC